MEHQPVFHPAGQLQQLKLHLHPGDQYVASFEPQSLQVLTYLKLANCSAKVTIKSTCYSNTPTLFPRSQPPIQHSYEIITHLKDLGHDIDSHLSQQERSEMLAYSDLLSDRLLPAILYMQWLDTDNYLNVTRLKYGKLLAFPRSLFYLSSNRKSVNNFIMRGSSPETTVEGKKIELLRRATECLSLLSSKLSRNKYLYGDQPSSLDAMLFGYLEVIRQCPLLGNNTLNTKLNSSHNLVGFCHRMKEDCFPQMKERAVSHSAGSQAEPANIWRSSTFWASVGVALLVLGVQGMRVGLLAKQS